MKKNLTEIVFILDRSGLWAVWNRTLLVGSIA